MRIYFADTRSFAQADTEALVKMLSALVKPKRLELYMRHRNITKLCAGALLYCAMKEHGIDYLNEKSAYTELGKEYFTEKAYIELSGACSVMIQVSEELKHDVATACKLTYFGSPQTKNLSESRNVIQGSR